MPSPRPHRNVVSPKAMMTTDRSMSFNEKSAAAVKELRRPRTVPDLRPVAAGNGVVSGKLTKVLINVTVQGSVGAVQVLMSPESTVREVVSGVVRQYLKEGRRPVILVKDVDHFDLHYSQFSLESLDREEKVAALGSRNFFMCKRKVVAVADGGDKGGVMTSSCAKQAEKATKLGSPCPWLKFMNFLF